MDILDEARYHELQRQMLERMSDMEQRGEGLLQYIPIPKKVEYCSDLLCAFCINQRIFQAGVDRIVADRPPIPRQCEPPNFRQRIWAKFCRLAQWITPSRN